MSLSDPCLIRSRGPSGEAVVRLGMTLQAQHDAASKGQDHEPTSSTDSPPASGRRSIMSSDRPDHMHSADARELFLAATSPASPHDEPVSASAGTFFRLRAPSRSLAGQRGNPPNPFGRLGRLSEGTTSMSNQHTVDRNQHDRARKLQWPVAGTIFLFTVSYPANDYAPPPSPPDIGLGMLLVYAGIAAVTVGVVCAGVLPWALRQEKSGGIALALAIVGTLLAPGFWTGIPPGLAAGGALLGWAGIYATKGRRLSQAAFVTGVLGVLYNIESYAEVFI
jgi:hypothetical protein